MKIRCVLFAFASVLVLGCADSGENPRMYSAGSVRWSSGCEPFEPAAGSSFGPADEPCIELILEGYYTRGDLTAVYRLAEQEIARSRIEFTPAGALFQRMARDGAESRVTFQLSHDASQPLPASDLYSVVMERSGTEVARYPFQIVDR